MPIIKPRGLLRGDRMGALSDEARLYWPFLYAGSNGFGYFEMDYPKILSRCFGQFHLKPTRELISRVLSEYRDQSLLFLYRDLNGRLWGAWDSAASQSFYTSEDKSAPKPPEPDFENWKLRYQQQKSQSGYDELSLEDIRPIDTKNKEIDNSLESTDISPKSTVINPLSRSISVSKHQSSITSQHQHVEEPKNSKVQILRSPMQKAFDEWWFEWTKIRGTNHKPQAVRAWLSVVTPENLPDVRECSTSYLSADGSRAGGYNPENFLFDQARDNFIARWPPPRAAPERVKSKRFSRLEELARQGEVSA